MDHDHGLGDEPGDGESNADSQALENLFDVAPAAASSDEDDSPGMLEAGGHRILPVNKHTVPRKDILRPLVRTFLFSSIYLSSAALAVRVLSRLQALLDSSLSATSGDRERILDAALRELPIDKEGNSVGSGNVYRNFNTTTSRLRESAVLTVRTSMGLKAHFGNARVIAARCF